ncbi:MAG: FKBP-type peptidyl-prolyl cis-trans isomerase N-terminal domain-containing protein [Verrucomicrobiales bacterium]
MTKHLFSVSLLGAGIIGFTPVVEAQNNAQPQRTKAAPISGNPAAPAPDPTKPLAEQIDMNKVSYLIGRSYGDNLAKQFVDVNFDELVRGLKSAIDGKDSDFTDEQAQELMNAFRPIHSARVGRMRQLEAFKVDEKGWVDLAAKNLADGKNFLAENAKKNGVKTTSSGLQYEIMKAGSGEIPKATDTVNAIYKGTLIDGTPFDDSKGKPRPFNVSRVVKGWQEALQMMPVGSKWRLTIPSDLGYGASGNRPPIGPNSTLVFEMELASIKKPVQAVTPPVGIDIPPRGSKPGTAAKPRKRITATTPPVTVPIPKKTDQKKPAETPKPEDK